MLPHSLPGFATRRGETLSKHAVLYKDKLGKRGWTIHADEAAAHTEARIHTNRGDVVSAIVPVDESPDYPFFKLSGYADDNQRANRFIEIWRDARNGKSLEDDDTVGIIGGFELSFVALQELHEYTGKAIEFLEMANGTHEEESVQEEKDPKASGAGNPSTEQSS